MLRLKGRTEYMTESEGILDHDNDGDPGSKFWSVYNHYMEKENIKLMKTWGKELDDVMLFGGLFSVVQGTLLAYTSKASTPDPAANVQLLLTQLVIGASTLSKGEQFTFSTPPPPPPPSFQSSTAISICNGLWIFSLMLSVTCALSASLIKQMGRNYLLQIRSETRISDRALKREMFYQGGGWSNIRMWIDNTVLGLQIAILLFFVGFAVFLWHLDAVIALMSLGIVPLLLLMIYCWYTLIEVANRRRSLRLS